MSAQANEASKALIYPTLAAQYPDEMSRFFALLLPLGAVFVPAVSVAGLAEDVTRCAALADDGARLACYDDVAVEIGQNGVSSGDAEVVLAALDREFRFDRSTRVEPLLFRLEVSQYLSVSRETGPGRDVERLPRRINGAIGDVPGWVLEITVHGAQVKIPRARPYSGDELLNQATRAMVRSGLAEVRFNIVEGADAEPSLWDDGRVRGSNENIVVEVTGL